MPFSMRSDDNQFSTATGRNVGSSGTSSDFDEAPEDSSSLVITTQDGDSDPRNFDVGDQYDLSWTDGSGVDHTMSDASVVRSDGSTGRGIIVFEGTDNLGETVQVIWSPGIDLQGWYSSTMRAGKTPMFYESDRDGSYSHEFICFEKTTKVMTPEGPIAVCKLKRGDRVRTWDGALRDVIWTASRTVPAQGEAAPIRFDTGSIGNHAPLKLSPQHRVLIRSKAALRRFGEEEVLVPAISLVDGVHIRQIPRDKITYVHVLLDRHDILLAEGAPCESLLPGERSIELVGDTNRLDFREAMMLADPTPARKLLHRREADEIVYDRELPLCETLLI